LLRVIAWKLLYDHFRQRYNCYSRIRRDGAHFTWITPVRVGYRAQRFYFAAQAFCLDHLNRARNPPSWWKEGLDIFKHHHGHL
jgi:hypothetical protein